MADADITHRLVANNNRFLIELFICLVLIYIIIIIIIIILVGNLRS